MATPAEKKALLFVAAVALLGGGVRGWQHWSPRDSDAPDDLVHASSHSKSHSKSRFTSRSASRASSSRQGKRSSRSKKPVLPEHFTIDLDIASEDEIDALGILKPGQARMLVRNRDEFGPFGSIQGLERIPYFPKSSITKLAPYAVFSRRPRPQQAVVASGIGKGTISSRTKRSRSRSSRKSSKAPATPKVGTIVTTQRAVQRAATTVHGEGVQ